MTLPEKCARRMVSEQGMDWDQLDGGDHGYWESLTRAVLTALRDPTPEMLEAANSGPGKPTNSVAAGIWVRMIDQALNTHTLSDGEG